MCIKERGCCFIKQNNGSIFQQSAGNRNALTLATRQGAAVFPDVRLIPLGQALDKFLALGGFGRSHHFLIGGIAPAQPDILHDSLIKEHDILKYNGIVLEQRFRFYRFDIHAAQGNGSGVRIPKTSRQFGGGGLAAAGRSYQRRMAMAWVIIFTVLIAAISVIRKGGIFDNVMRIICIIGICVPSFWLALILLTAFAVQIPIFSVISDGSFKSLILPSVAMAVPIICIAARVLRAAVLNELKSDYVTYARARGFSNTKIVYGEVLRNALPAAITLFAQYCAALFGTSALVESVFSIQGLGIYLMESCESMDIYGISGSILVCGVLFVLFNTLADLLSSAICPAYRRKAV